MSGALDAVAGALALLVAATALLAGAMALVVTHRPGLALSVCLDLLLAAGLLRLVGEPSLRAITTAATVVAIRRLVSIGLPTGGRRRRRQEIDRGPPMGSRAPAAPTGVARMNRRSRTRQLAVVTAPCRNIVAGGVAAREPRQPSLDQFLTKRDMSTDHRPRATYLELDEAVRDR